MTISTTAARQDYKGNNCTKAFAYTFKILANADLQVYVNNCLSVITTDYTVSGAGADTGGTVTFVSAPGCDKAVAIIRNIAYTQSTDYPENDPFPAASHEDALDKLTMLVQQVKEFATRSWRFAAGSVRAAAGYVVDEPKASMYPRIKGDCSGIEFVALETCGAYANPVTTSGDLIQGNATGVQARLAIGTANQIVGANAAATQIEYKTISPCAGFVVFHSAGSLSIGMNSGFKSGRFIPDQVVDPTSPFDAVKLIPFMGNIILINGVPRTIPSAGTTASFNNCVIDGVTGQTLTANTLYFVYIFLSGSTLTLEFSTTGRATDSTTGVEIKSGNATRTLIGLIRTDATGRFVGDKARQWTTSWFNRVRLDVSADIVGSTTCTSFITVDNTNCISFTAFSDDAANVVLCGSASNNTLNAGTQIAIARPALDGTPVVVRSSVARMENQAANTYLPFICVSNTAGGTDQFFDFTTLMKVTAGTGLLLSGGGETKLLSSPVPS